MGELPSIDADLVRQLLRDQFPGWAGLPIRASEHQGQDNHTFRLGDELAVRLPRTAAYTPGIHREQAVLPA